MVHTVFTPVEYVPGTHARIVAIVVVLGHAKPAGHDVHAVAAPRAYFPVVHATFAAPVVDEHAYPGAHCVQDACTPKE